MATVRATSWAGSSRVAWLLAALLILMALLGLLGAAPALRAGTAALGTPDSTTALRPCALPDVRVERARDLSATLLPRYLRAPALQVCAARC
ncbi:MAG: hypothetical protein K0R38_7238 [Polyangiaceae bacterium]|nr:hypothetical protein [Polyangiaceae bacterium]